MRTGPRTRSGPSRYGVISVSSADRLALARAIRLHLFLVGRDDVRGGVDGDEAKGGIAGVSDLVRYALGDQSNGSRAELLGLVVEDHRRRSLHHDDRLLRAIGVTRQALTGVDLEQGAPGRGRALIGAMTGRGPLASGRIVVDPGVLEIGPLEALGN